MASSDTKAESKTGLRDQGVYLLTATIDTESVKPVIEWILEENAKVGDDRKERLQLIVNSPGGHVTACFGLIDIMAGSPIPIDTLGLGCIASCGLTIFLYGERRVITPNTYILAHQYSSGAWGKHHELVADRKSQDWLHDRLVRIYMERTGLSRKKVESHLMRESDTHIDAEEAVKLGVAHKIKLR